MGVDAEMFVRLHQPISDESLKDAAYRLAEAMKSEVFMLSNQQKDFDRGERSRALNRLDKDDYWHPPDEGDWLRVPLWGRYYGPGYERGNLWDYIAVAEWIERNLDGTVYYRGDSGGMEDLVIFDRAYRQSLIAHWAEHGGRPYYQSSGWPRSGPEAPLCPLCEKRATQYGSGGTFASWTCDGCHRHWVWAGGTEIRMFDAERFGAHFDSFKAAEEMKKAAAAKS